MKQHRTIIKGNIDAVIKRIDFLILIKIIYFKVNKNKIKYID
jgi:hypothetical protein